MRALANIAQAKVLAVSFHQAFAQQSVLRCIELGRLLDPRFGIVTSEHQQVAIAHGFSDAERRQA